MQFDLKNIYNDATVWYTIITLIVFSIYYYIKNRNLPPGPIGLPYLGYWPFLGTSTCHLQLQELGKKYGDVFSFTVTGKLYINIGSFKANREAFIAKSEYFSDRIRGFTVANRIFSDSVGFISGEAWKTNRKFFQQQFRERGITSIKGAMCGPIYDAIKDTVEELRERKGEPLDIISVLTNKCSKILFHTSFGEKGITEQEIRELNESYAIIVENLTGPNMLLHGTIAKYLIFPFMPTYQKINKNVSSMENMIQEILDRHKATFDETNIRNIIDAYYKEKKEKLSKKDPTAEHFTDNYLSGSLVQFIGDGVLGVAAFIGAFFYTLLEHPEEQEKIYKELMEVIGTGRDPTMDDKNKLPYTNAFISEMLRTSNAFPFFPKLECTREVTLNGYRIPKGALTVMNIWASHFDPDEYDDPQTFNPSRFIATEGKRKPEQPILFGIGKRACLGEGFTMTQVFLFLTTVVKHFHLLTPENQKDEDFLFFSGRLNICCQPRKE